MTSSKLAQWPLGSPPVDPAYKATKSQILLDREVCAVDDVIRTFGSQLLKQTGWQGFWATDAELKMRECNYALQWAKLEEVEEGREMKNWMARKTTIVRQEDDRSGKMDGDDNVVTVMQVGAGSWEVAEDGEDAEAMARQRLHMAGLKRVQEQKRWQREANCLMHDAVAYGVSLDLPRLRH